jgi:hypothetical protein
MSKIKVGPKFFKRAREEYSNWPMAVARELAQNSQDAGANQVSISLASLDDNHCRLTWTDNGKGMDRQTLEDVFFALGESSKGSGDTGGFGKARELVCFGMDRYTIRTQNLAVEGSGDSYEIREEENYFHGCRMEIEIDRPLQTISNNIGRYFSLSNPRFSVKLNGAEITEFAAFGDHRRDLSFAQVFVNEAKEDQSCLVRVNGLFMFSRFTECRATIFVELNAARSRSLLTSNRDGMSYEHGCELDSFLNELSVDVKTAIRKRRGLKNGLYKGTQGLNRLISREEKERLLKKVDIGDAARSLGLDKTIESLQGKHHSRSVGSIERAISDAQIDLFTTIILDETDPNEDYKAMRDVRDQYNPTNWKTAYVNDKRTGEKRPYNIGGNRKKLLVMWKVACECCLEIMQEAGLIDTLTWSVGWLFCNDRGACCLTEGDSTFFCLRPVGMDGKMIYSLTKQEDLHRLVWLALHEALHVVNGYHDERYANNLTYLSPKVSIAMREILQRMAQAAHVCAAQKKEIFSQSMAFTA